MPTICPLKQCRGKSSTEVCIVHNPTKAQRAQCRKLVEEAKEKEQNGEGRFKVVGPPGMMKIVEY